MSLALFRELKLSNLFTRVLIIKQRFNAFKTIRFKRRFFMIV